MPPLEPPPTPPAEETSIPESIYVAIAIMALVALVMVVAAGYMQMKKRKK